MLEELFERKRGVEQKIDNYFDGDDFFPGDRGYQDLLEQLSDIQEEIDGILED